MRLTDKTATAIKDLIYRILGSTEAPVAKVFSAVFVAPNATDANLSQVKMTVQGDLVDAVPKNDGVTGLSAGDPLLLIRGPGVPLTIICRFHGDITAVQ